MDPHRHDIGKLYAHTPWGNALFGTAPPDAVVWLFILPFGIGMLLAEELRKALVRRPKM